MPVDADSILGTFRGMAQQLKDADNQSDAAKECFEVLQKMEDLALEMDDLAAYSTKLGVDNLYMDFSNAYGLALASVTTVDGDSSDEQLMATSLKAYEDSLIELKKNPSNAYIVPMVQAVVDKGKSGLSYPLFLKECEEQGLFLGLDSPHAGPTIKYDIYCCEIGFRPLEKEMHEKELEAYKALVSKAAFGYPDPIEWQVTRQKIEWNYAPRLALWDAIEDRWDRMFDMVIDWVDSFCKFAPYDDRWNFPGSSRAQTQKNIERTNECEPGKLKVREDIFYEYFNLEWEDIFTHETYLNKLNSGLIIITDEIIDLIRDVHTVMKPGARPTKEQIAKAEEIHEHKRFVRDNMPGSDDLTPMEFSEFLKTL